MKLMCNTAGRQGRRYDSKRAKNILGDTDVSNVGAASYAYNFSGTTYAVNGVSFTGTNSVTTVRLPIWNLSFQRTIPSAIDPANNAPFNALSANYKNILSAGDYTSGNTTDTVTLNLLTTNHVYAVQVNDERPISGRNLNLTSTSGNTVNLKYSTNNVAGSPTMLQLLAASPPTAPPPGAGVRNY